MYKHNPNIDKRLRISPSAAMPIRIDSVSSAA